MIAMGELIGMWLRVAALSSAVLLGGCAANHPFATFTGSAAALHTPTYAVRGKTNYDQAWINKTTEALVDSGQPRPIARPASMDAPPTKAAVAATVAAKTPTAQAAKRKKWFGF